MDVAKEILAVNPYQRIILASAFIMEFLADTVKQLTSCRINAESHLKPYCLGRYEDKEYLHGETKCKYRTNK